MWTPASGTARLAEVYGSAAALEHLERLLTEEVRGAELASPPYDRVLTCIGDGHAARLLTDPTGARLAHWPRVWAARAMAYLGDDAAATALLGALSDEHWRVRMTAAQTLGRLGIEGHEEPLGELLTDEHERVRAAAATALGRSGSEFALSYLEESLGDGAESVRERADRALARVEKRLRRGR